MVWFWRRISQLSRPPALLECMLMWLGASLTFLNLLVVMSAARLILCMKPPVQPHGELFCSHAGEDNLSCDCGEEETDFAWVWSNHKEDHSGSIVLEMDSRQVKFNPEYSSGTASIRTHDSLSTGCHHYWELKMTSAVYGTDIMVGVGTAKTDLSYGTHRFCSLLGRDQESWGYSYTGNVQFGGESRQYGQRWGKGSVVGVHLDSWLGTLEFFLNRQPLGVAFTGLQHKELYPVICSTSARSGMKLVSSCSFPYSLQLGCTIVLFKQIYGEMKIPSKDFQLPPGLKSFIENNYWPLLRSLSSPVLTTEDKEKSQLTVGGSGLKRCCDQLTGKFTKKFRSSSLIPLEDISLMSDESSMASSTSKYNFTNDGHTIDDKLKKNIPSKEIKVSSQKKRRKSIKGQTKRDGVCLPITSMNETFISKTVKDSSHCTVRQTSVASSKSGPPSESSFKIKNHVHVNSTVSISSQSSSSGLQLNTANLSEDQVSVLTSKKNAKEGPF